MPGRHNHRGRRCGANRWNNLRWADSACDYRMTNFTTTWACQSGVHCKTCRGDAGFRERVMVAECPRALPMGYDPADDIAIYVLGNRENPTMSAWLGGLKNVVRWPAHPKTQSGPQGHINAIAQARNDMRADFMRGDKRFMLQLDDDLLPDGRLSPILQAASDIAAPIVWRDGHVQHGRQPFSANALRLSRRACGVLPSFTGRGRLCECVVLWKDIQNLLPLYPWLKPVRVGVVDHPNKDGTIPKHQPPAPTWKGICLACKEYTCDTRRQLRSAPCKARRPITCPAGKFPIAEETL